MVGNTFDAPTGSAVVAGPANDVTLEDNVDSDGPALDPAYDVDGNLVFSQLNGNTAPGSDAVLSLGGNIDTWGPCRQVR